MTTSKTLRNRRKRQSKRARDKVSLASTRLGNAHIIVTSGENATRSGTKPNPADPRTVTPLMQLGNTEAGRAAALKILHPNGEGSMMVTKIPDGAVNSSVVMERRDEFVITSPTTNPGGDNWNCIIVEMPFLIATQVVVRWPISQTPTTAQVRAAVGSSMNLPSITAAQYPAFDVATIAGTPAFDYEYSILASTTLTPTILADTAALAGLVKSIRRTYLGSTIDFDAASLTNQGRVVAGQWTPDVSLATSRDGATPPASFDSYLVQTPAVVDSEIVQSDELRVAHEAKCGLYFPNRLGSMGPLFTSSGEMRALNVTSTGAPNQPLTYSTDCLDLWLRGWLIGVSNWSNMDNTTSLRIKRNEGLELVTSPSSTYSPFATPALPSDVRAMQIIQEFGRCEPHAYIADFNELGTMLRNILSSAGGAVANLGLPILSNVGHAISGLANSKLGGRLASALDAF